VSSALYLAGWRRLHRASPGLAHAGRLLAFGAVLAALSLALVWPLPGWSSYLLTMRSAQKVLVALIAPAFFWLACPLHTMAWGLGSPVRRRLVRVRHASGWGARAVRAITQPLVTWFVFVSAFLFWHDPQTVAYLAGDTWAHDAAPWVLLGAALLFWGHVAGTGLRLRTPFPTWLLIVYLLGVEIPNMVAGVTIAFADHPLYPYYARIHARYGERLLLDAATDQMIGGAIIWVFGSLFYVTSIVLVVHRLFREEGSTAPQPLPGWDAHEKLIAPGLEHRARQNLIRGVDLSHH
jgi:putative membrane protein